MIDEQTRSRYADALRKLSEFYPDKCDERVKLRYFERLVEKKACPDAVEEAVEKLIDSQKTRVFPPWSAIAERLRDIAKDQRGGLAVESDPPPQLSPEEWAAVIAENKKLRLKVFPKAKPNIRTDREHRCQVLGIVPLTQAQIDDLNSKKRDRERARRSGSGGAPF